MEPIYYEVISFCLSDCVLIVLNSFLWKCEVSQTLKSKCVIPVVKLSIGIGIHNILFYIRFQSGGKFKDECCNVLCSWILFNTFNTVLNYLTHKNNYLIIVSYFLLTWAESSSELFWSPFVVVCLSVSKLFLFSTSSQEQLGQFQPNLAQSILGWKGFKFVQMKGPTFSKGR